MNKMWEFIEREDEGRYGHRMGKRTSEHELEKAYECGYEDGYREAMKEAVHHYGERGSYGERRGRY
jgi:hypothetical protein